MSISQHFLPSVLVLRLLSAKLRELSELWEHASISISIVRSSLTWSLVVLISLSHPAVSLVVLRVVWNESPEGFHAES